jgi:hypothetical protein
VPVSQNSGLHGRQHRIGFQLRVPIAGGAQLVGGECDH